MLEVFQPMYSITILIVHQSTPKPTKLRKRSSQSTTLLMMTEVTHMWSKPSMSKKAWSLEGAGEIVLRSEQDVLGLCQQYSV